MAIRYTPQNLCGRRINYPHFGALQDVPPPGVEVFPTPCEQYYKSRNFADMTEDCKDCIYQSYDVDRNCPCDLKTAMTSQDLCEFADCVVTKQRESDGTKCSIPFNALFNVGDVDDELYTPPFGYNDLRCGGSPSGAPSNNLRGRIQMSYDGQTGVL